MVRFMKKSTINLTTLVRGSTRFFGMMLSVALLVPAEAMSQVVYSNPPTVNLLTAGNFTVLGGSAVTVGVGTTVTGDVGVYPTATLTNNGTVNGTIFTCTHSTTGPNITGNATYCALATQARLDAQTAYLFLAAMPSGGVLAGNLAGTTIAPGVYTNSSSVLIQGGDLTLDA